MTDRTALGERAIRAIEDHRAELIALSMSLHAEPEIGYQEHKSAAKLAAFLETNGFAVTRAYRGVETSYRGDAAGNGAGIRLKDGGRGRGGGFREQLRGKSGDGDQPENFGQELFSRWVLAHGSSLNG